VINPLRELIFSKIGTANAHSPGRADRGASGCYHTLKKHIDGVLTLARRFGRETGLEEQAAVLAALHDFGKTREGFQKMLRGERPDRKEDTYHSAFGALSLHTAARERGSLWYHVLSALVLGHHGGPKDFSNVVRDRIPSVARGEKELSLGEAVLAVEVGAELAKLETSFVDKDVSHLKSLMALSCLVDADWLDTEAHFDPAMAARRRKESPRNTFETLEFKVEARCAGFSADTPVNAIRATVRSSALSSAERVPWLYTFTGPTGVGKTFASMSFAMKHARVNDMQRVIYVAPYISVVDQNAAVFEDTLGTDYVLTHHSNVVYTPSKGLPSQHKLGTTNWDFPVVCTTGVAFIEALFSNTPTRVRKLHNVANSVILIDEAQFLPVDKMAVISAQLDSLVRDFNCSIVLMTATQPEVVVDKNPYKPERLRVWPRGAVEIVQDVDEVFKSLKRVEVVDDTQCETTPQALAEAVAREGKSALVVLNRKTTASKVAGVLESLLEPGELIHLSTTMCPAHRRKAIASVHEKLACGDKCVLVSTQVVEAGVDVSFPVGWRDVGPLDSIIQVKGRVNRSNEFGGGKLTVVNLGQIETKYLGEAYNSGRELALSVLRRGLDIDSPKVVSEYFRNNTRPLNTNKLQKGSESERVDLKRAIRDLMFKTVGDHFHMIDGEGQVSIVVNYGGAEKILSEASGIDKKKVKELQPYTVSVRDNQFERLLAAGALYEITVQQQDAREPGVIYVLKPEFYSGLYGVLVPEARKE